MKKPEFNDAILKEPNVVFEIENPPKFVEITDCDRILFNSKYTSEKRVRTFIYEMLKLAVKELPDGYSFVVYEALRPKSAQIILWNEIVEKYKKELPDMDPESEEFIAKCNNFVANPYRRGSGHQSGAAVDVTICDETGHELEMGSFVRDFSSKAKFNATDLSETAIKNRNLLRNAMESVGFVNYPSEWWHYSFGDRLWARLTKSEIAIFKNID